MSSEAKLIDRPQWLSKFPTGVNSMSRLGTGGLPGNHIPSKTTTNCTSKAGCYRYSLKCLLEIWSDYDFNLEKLMENCPDIVDSNNPIPKSRPIDMTEFFKSKENQNSMLNNISKKLNSERNHTISLNNADRPSGIDQKNVLVSQSSNFSRSIGPNSISRPGHFQARSSHKVVSLRKKSSCEEEDGVVGLVEESKAHSGKNRNFNSTSITKSGSKPINSNSFRLSGDLNSPNSIEDCQSPSDAGEWTQVGGNASRHRQWSQNSSDSISDSLRQRAPFMDSAVLVSRPSKIYNNSNSARQLRPEQSCNLLKEHVETVLNNTYPGGVGFSDYNEAPVKCDVSPQFMDFPPPFERNHNFQLFSMDDKYGGSPLVDSPVNNARPQNSAASVEDLKSAIVQLVATPEGANAFKEIIERSYTKSAASSDSATPFSQNLTQPPPGMEINNQPKWFYVDPHGMTHGPFSNKTMSNWLEGKYFNPSLLLRRDCDMRFSALNSYFGLYRSSNPFMDLNEHPPPIAASDLHISNGLNNRERRNIWTSEELSTQEPLKSEVDLHLWQAADQERVKKHPDWSPSADSDFLNGSLEPVPQQAVWGNENSAPSQPEPMQVKKLDSKTKKGHHKTQAWNKTNVVVPQNLRLEPLNVASDEVIIPPQAKDLTQLQQLNSLVYDSSAPWSDSATTQNPSIVKMAQIQAEEELASRRMEQENLEQERLRREAERLQKSATSLAWTQVTQAPSYAKNSKVSGTIVKSLAEIQAEEEALALQLRSAELSSQIELKSNAYAGAAATRSAWSNKIKMNAVIPNSINNNAIVSDNISINKIPSQIKSPEPVSSIWGSIKSVHEQPQTKSHQEFLRKPLPQKQEPEPKVVEPPVCPFVSWAEQSLSKLCNDSTQFRIADLIEIVSGLSDENDVQEILTQCLGESKNVEIFCSEFLEKRRQIKGVDQSVATSNAAGVAVTTSLQSKDSSQSVSSKSVETKQPNQNSWQTAASRSGQNKSKKKKTKASK